MLDHDVAELRRRTERAAVRATVEDQPAADAGAERQHDQVARPLACTGVPLADRRGVCVVLDNNIEPGRGTQLTDQVNLGV